MASATDDPTETTPVPTEVVIGDTNDVSVQPESAGDENAAEEAAASVEDVSVEDEANEPVSATETIQAQPDNRFIAATAVETGKSADVNPAANNVDLSKILESLQDSLDKTQYVSSKIGAVSDDTERLIKQVNGISMNCELLTAEMEQITSGARTKNMLSKLFMSISSVVLVLLVIFQVYMFISQLKMQQLQNTAGSAVLENVSNLNKKMADYNNNLTKALEKPAPQEHAQPNPAAPQQAGHEAAGNVETGGAKVTPVLEKLNKLRSGLPEKKLFRKETGDWFVYNKKSEECIADVDVIEALNQAYRKIGRSVSPTVPMPAHKSLCILKPDGKGGTEVVMTKEFIP